MTESEPTSSAINLNRGSRVGRIEIHGNVAGRDVVLQALADEASTAQDRQQVLELLARIEQRVAALEAAPPGLRGDAVDELRKAHDAGAQGDKSRLSEKLAAARDYLMRIGSEIPDALALAQTVATIATKVVGLW